jgi:hypothetical protein
MVATSQSFYESANGGNKVYWWRYPVVYQDEGPRQSLHLPQHWQTLPCLHLVQNHAGSSVVKVTTGEIFQFLSRGKDDPHVPEPQVSNSLMGVSPHAMGSFDSHQFRTRISKEKDKFPRAAADINEGTSWFHLVAYQLSRLAQSWIYK